MLEVNNECYSSVLQINRFRYMCWTELSQHTADYMAFCSCGVKIRVLIQENG